MLRRILMLLAVGVFATAFVAACNGDDTEEVLDQTGVTDDATPEGEDPDQGEARTDDGGTAGQTNGGDDDEQAEMLSDRLDVVLSDHEIDMPSTAGEGIVAFFMVNEGDEDHGIAVAHANGDDEEILGMMEAAPGNEIQLELELEAGEYVVFCPVGDHREEHGMETTLTVEPVEDD